jgi:hypothetical protein
MRKLGRAAERDDRQVLSAVTTLDHEFQCSPARSSSYQRLWSSTAIGGPRVERRALTA